jgi:hypothetical protein
MLSSRQRNDAFRRPALRRHGVSRRPVGKLVGVAGFEPATPSSRTKHPTALTAEIQANPDQSIAEGSFSVHGNPGPLRKPPDPPDKKRSPGAVGTAAGTNRRGRSASSNVQLKNTKSKPKTQAQDRLLSVYDGRVRLASITGSGGEFVVVMADGALLGNFKTLGQASAAISTAHGGGR